MKTNPVLKRISMGFILVVMMMTFCLPTIASAEVIDPPSGGVILSPGAYPSLGGDEDTETYINDALGRSKVIAMGITGSCALVAFVAMIIAITKLTAAGDDVQRRKSALAGILVSGIGIALLGSSTMIIYFFWNLLVPASP